MKRSQAKRISKISADIARIEESFFRSDDPDLRQRYSEFPILRTHSLARPAASAVPMSGRISIGTRRRRLTAAALAFWLKPQSYHPTMPNFIVSPQQVRNVSAYLLSLRD
jgi:hypothetical protein